MPESLISLLIAIIAMIILGLTFAAFYYTCLTLDPTIIGPMTAYNQGLVAI